MNNLFYAFFILFALSSCLKDKTVPLGECSETVSYAADIRPIIEATCKTGLGPGTGCHDAWIDNYDPIKSYIISNTWQNVVLTEKTMPKFPNSFGIDSLTEENLKAMKCWIEQGYPQN